MLARSPMKKATTRKCGCPSNLGVGRHRRACAKWKPAPKPKARKPIPHRNAKRRPADAGSAQREAVMARASGRCKLEVRVTYRSGGTDFLRCTERTGLQTVHVIRRRACGDAWADPDVAVAGCVRCHDVFDHRTPSYTWDSVRMPEWAVTRAIACVKRYEAARPNCKSTVALRGRKDEN
jgi:hypothetical protein